MFLITLVLGSSRDGTHSFVYAGQVLYPLNSIPAPQCISAEGIMAIPQGKQSF